MQIGSVTLVVPCRNEEKYRPTLFASLDAQKVKGCAMEIIFVDGMSTDCTSAMLAEFAKTRPEVKVLKNPARIVPCAINLGIRAAVGDLIMRIDANAEYAPDYVAKYLEFSTRTGAENVGGAAPAKGSGYIVKSIGGLWKQNFMNGVWAVYTRYCAICTFSAPFCPVRICYIFISWADYRCCADPAINGAATAPSFHSA
jgi:glycosyltransferase involved in cell wall biosynthesis